MKLFTEAFLDKWEARATAGPGLWQKEPESNRKRLVMALSPHLRLQPTERYNFRLYLRQVAITGLPVVFFISIVWLFPVALLWYKYPFVVHDPKYHKLLIGLLSHSGFYTFPWIMLSLLAFDCVLYLPGYCFWDRRAERLRREPPPPAIQVEAFAVDASVWPPPPTLTRD